MVKEDIAKKVFEATEGLTQGECLKIVDAVLKEMRQGIDEDGILIFRKFGSFKCLSKAERPGRNPKNKIPAPISARRVVRFKASKHLKRLVDNEAR